MKTITLNPESGMKIYHVGNRKFVLGAEHKFNDSTAKKFLADEINGVPSFVEVDLDPKAPPVKEPSFGQTDTMDRNDAKKVEAEDEGEEV